MDPVGPVGPVMDAPVGPVGPPGPVGPVTPLTRAKNKDCVLEKFVVPVPPELSKVTGNVQYELAAPGFTLVGVPEMFQIWKSPLTLWLCTTICSPTSRRVRKMSMSMPSSVKWLTLSWMALIWVVVFQRRSPSPG